MRRRCSFFQRDNVFQRDSFFQGNSGAALVEFAIVLGLIMLSGAAAMLCLGSESEKAFAVLVDRNGGNVAEPAVAPAGEPHGDESHDDESHAESPRREVAEHPQFILEHRTLTAIFFGLLLVGYLAARLRRWRAKRALQQIDEDREIVERIDNKRFAKRQEILRVLASDPDALLENRLEVRHLMNTSLRTVLPKTTLDEMKAIIEAEQVRHFPVVTDKGILVGIVCDRDLIGTQARFAADAMTRTLITVSPTTRLNSALAQIINRNLACLPVMHDEKLVGLLTTTELVMTLQCALQLMKHKARPAQTATEQVPVG